jgi:hypothetical protein
MDEFLMGLSEGSYYALGYEDDITILINEKFPRMASEVLKTELGIIQQCSSAIRQACQSV